MSFFNALIMISASAQTGACPVVAPNAAEICANVDVAVQKARLDVAFDAWAKVDSRQATIRADRAVAEADYRTGFVSWANDPAKGAPVDLVIEALSGIADEAESRAKIAGSVAAVPDLTKIASRCQMRTFASCSVLASGQLNSGDGKTRLVWQRVQGNDDAVGIMQAVMAWDVSGAKPVKIGHAFAEGIFENPQLVGDGTDTVGLHAAGRGAGTSESNIDVLFQRYATGAWTDIDLDSWSSEFAKKLPAGLGVWKGVDYDFDGMWARTPLWRDSDANCCGTGGEANINFDIAGDRLTIRDWRYYKPGEVSESDPAIATCPITRMVYAQDGNEGVTAGFAPQGERTTFASDLVFWVEGAGKRHYFGFASPNGYGGTYIYPRIAPSAVKPVSDDAEDGPSDALPSAKKAKGTDDSLQTEFDAFNAEMVPMNGPPQADSPAPAALFSRELGPLFHYGYGALGLTAMEERASVAIALWRPVSCLSVEHR